MDNDISTVMGGQAFVPGNVPDAGTGFDALPVGWYPVAIETAEVKDTKAGTGKLIAVMMTVIGDRFAGRKLFAHINIQNPNATCQEIGQRELAGLGLACELAAITSTDQIIGKNICVKVKIVTEKKNRATGKKEACEPDNEISGYRPLSAAPAPTAPLAAEPAAPTTAAPAKSKMPWEQ